MSKGKLLVISGFSGVGKGTVVKYLKDNYNDFELSISVTTREPRENEVEGVHYFFVSNDEFNEMVKKDELLEHAGFVEHFYGTPRKFVEDKLNKGIDVVLEIETKGALQIKEKMPEAILIFVLPPSAEELKNRLFGRNTETEEVIFERLKKASKETSTLDKYDYFVLNDDVEKCAKHIEDIKNNNNPKIIDSEIVEKIKKEILAFGKENK